MPKNQPRCCNCFYVPATNDVKKIIARNLSYYPSLGYSVKFLPLRYLLEERFVFCLKFWAPKSKKLTRHFFRVRNVLTVNIVYMSLARLNPTLGYHKS